MGRINTLEKQNKVLKTRLDDATDENLALRENNIKFQVEIFRLRRKITEMEANEEQEQKPAVVEGDFFAEPKEECRPSAPKRRQPVNPVEVEVPVKKPKQSKPKPLPPPVKDSSSEDDEEEEPEVKVENKDLEMQPWNGIKFTKAQRKALNDTIDGKAGDSKFINQICMFLWDDLTLINSSVTGIPSNNTNAIAWSQSPLDPDKLKYLKSKKLSC